MMKLKQFNWIVLLTILCLSSCSKDDESKMPESTEKMKSVIIKMDISRDANPTRASVENPNNGTGLLVNNLEVYFYNKGTSIIYSVNNISTLSEMSEIGGASGMEFSNLHPNVNAIAIVANTLGKGLSVPVTGFITDLFSKPVNIVYEQNYYNLTLFGKSEELIINEATENADPNIDYYSVTIALASQIARIEVSQIACTDLGASFSSLTLKSIFVDNVYENNYLGSETTSNLFEASIEAVLASSQAWWIYTLANNQSITQTPYSPNGDDAFIFHIIPSTMSPWLRLHLKADPKDGSATVDRFINIKNFVSPDGPVVFEANGIYKISLPFDEIDIAIFDDTEQDLSVGVTVHQWGLVAGVIPNN